MTTYMKAYRLADLRRYPRFRESKAEFASLPAESIVYLREDGVVVRGCFGSELVLFESAAPEWPRFCREELAFEVPDWEADALRLRAQSGMES